MARNNTEMPNYQSEPMEAIHTKVSRSLDASFDEIAEIIVSAHWDPKNVRRKRKVAGVWLVQDMEQIIVATGGRRDAIITSCGQYMRTQWWKEGTALLTLLCRFLNSGKGRFASLELADPPAKLSMAGASASKRKPLVTFFIRAKPQYIISFAQQLAWLGATFRKTSKHGLALSSYDFTRVGPRSFHLEPVALEYFKPAAGECACWQSILRDLTIAADFPIPPRRKEVGLELECDFTKRVTSVENSFIDAAHGAQAVCVFLGSSTRLYQTAVMVPRPKEPDWVRPTLQWSLVPSSSSASSCADDLEFSVPRARNFVGCQDDACGVPWSSSKVTRVVRRVRRRWSELSMPKDMSNTLLEPRRASWAS